MSYKAGSRHPEDFEQPLQFLKEPKKPEGGQWERPTRAEPNTAAKEERESVF